MSTRIPETRKQEQDTPQPTDRLVGHWTMYDQATREILSNDVELWASPTECGVVIGNGDDRRAIHFDDKKIVWALTCMIRLMRKHGASRSPMKETGGDQ